MDLIEIEGGEVLANLEDRTITGRLIPYGEEGRTNAGRFMVEAGAIDLSEAIADPSIIGLNLDHERHNNVGRGTRVWDQADGVYCTWAIARTPAGDAALADATSPQGKRRRLSGEFGPAMIRAGKLVAGHARLWGSALVERGAFDGAMVLASDTPETTPATPATTEGESTVDETTEALAETTTETAATTDVLAAAVPPTLGTPSTAVVVRENNGPSAQHVLAAMAAIRNPLNAAPPADAVQVLAALSDITTVGLAAGGEIARPAWLGQLYQGVPYIREYITLGTLGTAISLGGKQGYTLHRGTSGSPVDRLGATWAGEKTEIASGVGFSKAQVSTLIKWAFGADIAREFFDLPGAEEALEAFFRLVLEDHLVWSDERALETWRLTAGLPVAPKTYPSVDGHDYAGSIGQVIQAILAVKAKKTDGRRDTPTFIIANELAYEELIYTPKDLLPEFVNFTASTDWQGSGDGLRLVVGDTGITSTTSVIVGSGRAVEFDELPGGPLRVDALDLARGGVDRALHAYLQTFVVRPEAVVHVGTADTRANTTAYAVGDLAKVSAVVYQAVVAGTSSGTAPTAPAVGATVVDGSVTWKRLV
jgi:hypothetical protein